MRGTILLMTKSLQLWFSPLGFGDIIYMVKHVKFNRP